VRILVTDGQSRAALAITRSLGEKGHDVHVAAVTARSVAASSKYCHKSHIYPDPASDRAGYLDTIEDLIDATEIDILLPVTDICLFPVVEQLDRFRAICSVPFASISAIEKAANKDEITQLAQKLGVATPRSRTIASKGSGRNEPWDGQFPVVLKSSRSRVKVGSGWLFTGVDYADSASQLARKLEQLPDAAYPVLLQERIKGPGIGVFYCFDNGRRIATFAHRRLQEKPPSGGVSVLRESVRPDPKADEYGQALLSALNWHGVAMVEFKLDERDNIPKLMEINGRFWGSLQLAIDSGVDFPDLLVRMASGESLQEIDDYEVGVRSRWLCGELDLLLLFLLKSRTTLNLPAHHPSRFLSALKVINPFVRRQKLEVLRVSDIKPWLYEVRQWLRAGR